MTNRDEMFAVSLKHVRLEKRLTDRDVTNLELVRLQILAGTAVQGIMIAPIPGVHVCGHSPNCILKTQGRAHVRRSVKRPQVVSRMNDGQEMLL